LALQQLPNITLASNGSFVITQIGAGVTDFTLVNEGMAPESMRLWGHAVRRVRDLDIDSAPSRVVQGTEALYFREQRFSFEKDGSQPTFVYIFTPRFSYIDGMVVRVYLR